MLAAAMAVQTIVKPGFPPSVSVIRTEIGPGGRRVSITSSKPEPGHDVESRDSRTRSASVKGTASFDVLCECCGRECCGPTTPASNMDEAEAVQAEHLAESRRCADWAAGRSTRETFKIRSRKTR